MIGTHRVSAIVTCAGRATRFGSNKLLVPIDGVSVLERTVRQVVHPLIDEVVVTVNPDFRDVYRKILVEDAGLPVTLVDGGSERFVSAWNGLAATTGDIVLVHDGVRPFVRSEHIERVLEAGVSEGAAMLGIPTVVQLKLVDDDEYVTGSLDRAHSWLGQTPQVFRRDLLEHAYRAALRSEYRRVSDDADLVAEFTGHRVRIVLGDDDNIKITTRNDLALAEVIQRRRSGSGAGADVSSQP